jgi:hypothetical protein
MQKKSFIDSIRVANPCSESWDEMTGNDRVRFCSHCAKDVNDLSAMTRKEAVRVVRKSGGALCIRYVEEPVTKAPLFAEQLTQITRRRVPLMAAGVMSASLSLATMAYAQGGAAQSPVTNSPSAARVSECEDDGSNEPKKKEVHDTSVRPALRGTVLDAQGAVVPNLAVTLNDGNARVVASTRSDAEGAFRFEQLSPGKYSLRTEASAGFSSSLVENIAVGEGETAVDINVNVAGGAQLMGVVAVGPEFEGALAIAVSNDNFDEARQLISHGENVNWKEGDGTTPLFIAVENGNIDMVRLLLDSGAKINARNDEKETPIMRLDADASPELVEMLLRFGAKVNETTKSGDTALIRSVARQAKPEVVKALVDAGAQLDVQDNEGMTALMFAADADDLETVRVLLFAGANVNLKDNDKETAWDKTSDAEIETLLETYGAVIEDDGTASAPQL